MDENLYKSVEERLKILLADPILEDLPRNPSLQDVEALIAYEKGSAVRLKIVKLDGSYFGLSK